LADRARIYPWRLGDSRGRDQAPCCHAWGRARRWFSLREALRDRRADRDTWRSQSDRSLGLVHRDRRRRSAV